MSLQRWFSIGIMVVVASSCAPRVKTPAAVAVDIPPDSSGYAYTTLANVENARFALARGQTLPAQNDVVDAIAAAKRLKDETPTVFLRGPPLTPSPDGRARIAESTVQLRLTEAVTALRLGDPAWADSRLALIQQGADPALIPPTLPLVRAQAGLALAQGALSSGRTADARAQLEAAAAALQEYARSGAGDHRSDAMALQATLTDTLARDRPLDGLYVGQADLWSQRVKGWL